SGTAIPIINASGAIWDFESTALLQITSGTATFSNSGVLKRTTASGGRTKITPAFTNNSTGVVDVQIDTIEFNGSTLTMGGTVQGFGTIRTNSATTVSFAGATINPGGLGTAGILRVINKVGSLSGATINIDVGTHISNSTIVTPGANND